MLQNPPTPTFKKMVLEGGTTISEATALPTLPGKEAVSPSQNPSRQRQLLVDQICSRLWQGKQQQIQMASMASSPASSSSTATTLTPTTTLLNPQTVSGGNSDCVDESFPAAVAEKHQSNKRCSTNAARDLGSDGLLDLVSVSKPLNGAAAAAGPKGSSRQPSLLLDFSVESLLFRHRLPSSTSLQTPKQHQQQPSESEATSIHHRLHWLLQQQQQQMKKTTTKQKNRGLNPEAHQQAPQRKKRKYGGIAGDVVPEPSGVPSMLLNSSSPSATAANITAVSGPDEVADKNFSSFFHHFHFKKPPSPPPRFTSMTTSGERETVIKKPHTEAALLSGGQRTIKSSKTKKRQKKEEVEVKGEKSAETKTASVLLCPTARILNNL